VLEYGSFSQHCGVYSYLAMQRSRANESKAGENGAKTGLQKRRKKKESPEDALARERAWKEALLQTQANIEQLRKLTQENETLRDITEELSLMLKAQNEGTASIMADLIREVEKVMIEDEKWTKLEEAVRESKQRAHEAQIKEEMEELERHRLEMSELRQSLFIAREEYRTLDPDRKEQKAMNEEIQKALDELETARRMHQMTLSNHQHQYALEQENLKKDMIVKIRMTKMELLNLVETQLETETKRTILEYIQLRNELDKLSERTSFTLSQADAIRARMKELRRELELESEACGLMAEQELLLQRFVSSVSSKLTFLQQLATSGDLVAIQKYIAENPRKVPKPNHGGSLKPKPTTPRPGVPSLPLDSLRSRGQQTARDQSLTTDRTPKLPSIGSDMSISTPKFRSAQPAGTYPQAPSSNTGISSILNGSLKPVPLAPTPAESDASSARHMTLKSVRETVSPRVLRLPRLSFKAIRRRNAATVTGHGLGQGAELDDNDDGDNASSEVKSNEAGDGEPSDQEEKGQDLEDSLSTKRNAQQVEAVHDWLSATGRVTQEEVARRRANLGGRVKQLEDAIAKAEGELQAAVSKAATARLKAQRISRSIPKILGLQDEALTLIETVLTESHTAGRAALGSGLLPGLPFVSVAQLQLSSGTSASQSSSVEDRSQQLSPRQQGKAPLILPQSLDPKNKVYYGDDLAMTEEVKSVVASLLKAHKREDSSELNGAVLQPSETVPLVRWPVRQGIPSRISNIVINNAQELLALLHDKLNVAPVFNPELAASESP